MKAIGSALIDPLESDPVKKRLGFHVPPFISIKHLHLHAFVHPFKDNKTEEHDSPEPNNAWFVEMDNLIETIEKHPEKKGTWDWDWKKNYRGILWRLKAWQ